ncbi:MAG: leucine-rich repeat domain-containing protein [Clostridia bacterium]|nr:leucine-rich repeat domain-containing protein [Clostridia bacterium]
MISAVFHNQSWLIHESGLLTSESTLTVTAANVWTYQWQYSYDKGTTWNNCTDSSFSTETYEYIVEEKHYDRLLRCRLTAHDGSFVYTDTAALTIPELIDSGTCGENGDNITWTLIHKNEYILTISGSGRMKDYNSYQEAESYLHTYNTPWRAYRDKIYRVVFEGDVTYIGNNAFAADYWLYRSDRYYHPFPLTSVVIPGSVKQIGQNAFWHQSNLRKVVLSDGVAEIGDQAFYCNSDKLDITIPKSVTKIGSLNLWKGIYNGYYDVTEILPEIVVRVYKDSYAYDYAKKGWYSR